MMHVQTPAHWREVPLYSQSHPQQQSSQANLMNILSSSTYTQNTPQLEMAPRNDQLYGGLVAEVGTEEPREVKPAKRPRKRKAEVVDDGSDDASKRQRGRPRLDPQDETAIDRRRTQIRLAQRAYRNRKETTITTLQQKVDRLYSVLDRMKDTFGELHQGLMVTDVIVSQGELHRRLESMKKDFAEISKERLLGDDQEDEEHPVKAHTPKERPVSKSTSTLGSPATKSPTDSVSTISLPAQSHSSTRALLDSPGDDARLESPGTLVAQQSLPPQSLTVDYSDSFMPQDSINAYKAEGSNWSWPDGLDIQRAFPARSFYTYSFQETNFSRRLLRVTVERALGLLGNPATSPTWLAQKFRFSFTFATRDTITKKFQNILQRQAGESLEIKELPYLHIGGAGTHFPRRGPRGEVWYPPNLISPLDAAGLWQLLDPSRTASADDMAHMLGQLGFAGDWFDAHDVEEYLKTKGIFLDGQSSFTDIDTAGITLPGGSTSTSTTTGSDGGVATPSSPRSSLGDSYGLSEADFGYMMGPHNSLELPKSTVADFAAGDLWSGALRDALVLPNRGSIYDQLLQQMAPRHAGIITLDVDKLMGRLISSAVCFGSAPGYSRAAVDDALALAVQEAF